MTLEKNNLRVFSLESLMAYALPTNFEPGHTLNGTQSYYKEGLSCSKHSSLFVRSIRDEEKSFKMIGSVQPFITFLHARLWGS